MSGTDVALQDQPPAGALVPAEESSAEDAMFMGLVRHTKRMAPALARMPGLNKSLIVTTGRGDTKTIDHDATHANVEAVGFTLATYGVRLNATNVQQFDLIQGTLTPRCQLQMGIVTALTGHSIGLDPSSDENSATAVLVRADNGQRHESTYTVDQAKASGALDFWVERWASGRPVERIVLGYTEAEARTAQASHHQAWVKAETIKSLEAWHKYRADMLARRALKRVMRWGAPEVVAGVVSLQARPAGLMPDRATVKIDMDLVDGGDPDIAALGDRPALPAYEPVPPQAVANVKAFGRRIIRLHTQIEALPEDWRHVLELAWDAKGLPALDGDDFMPHHLDEAEAVLDQITAEALRQQAPKGEPCPSESAPPTGATEAASPPGTGESPTATAGRPPARPTSTGASAAPEPSSDSETAQPTLGVDVDLGRPFE